MPTLFSLIATFTLFLTCSYAAVPAYSDLHVVNRYIAPDGFNRSAVLMNGVFPGPLIFGYTGGRFRLNVINELTDNTMLRSTSIHWHGFFQKGTNWADGASFVNQCPITPQKSFLYDFRAPGQAGTFWYHSHLSTQYCDGLRGPMVVYDVLDPHRWRYDIDDESTIITLSDWYHTPAPSAGRFPTAESTLINGLGRYAGGPSSSLTVINVRRGLRYRFRLISLSCDPNYTFSIDGHTMTIIESDGVSTQPIDVDSLQIFAGQRYSFVLQANQPLGNYWIRANPNAGSTGFEGGLNSAILRYQNAPNVDPTTNQTTSTRPLRESSLVPLRNAGAPGRPVPGGADVNINLAMSFDPTTLDLKINGAKFQPPSVPVLLQIISGAQSAKDLLPSGSVYTLPSNKVIELSIPALTVGGPHPFHLHGHTFDVVRTTGSETYNYVNPPRRDVVSTGLAGDNVTIRFTTDNPGPWFLHCHIDWHLEVGLAVVFVEDAADTSRMNPIPNTWSDLCPTYTAENPDTSVQIVKA
ncbi:laccase 5 [Desarmillaria tabescens]|uniref:laccase n=1 Tax=Armillaria tabescens TaxID=1929756 RepID=A0AA39NPD4_ARMTA|nr:laccase 5 [Desarmillaria tabescens]KAK0469397.1 laccase 5 [Desarmillaria tabescens]